MNFKHGNTFKDSQDTRGWFIGDFEDKLPPIKSKNFEMKLSKHTAGEGRSKENASKDSKKTTVIVLIKGSFEVSFPEHDQTISLINEGDYVQYDKNILHSWQSKSDSTILTLRFVS